VCNSFAVAKNGKHKTVTPVAVMTVAIARLLTTESKPKNRRGSQALHPAHLCTPCTRMHKGPASSTQQTRRSGVHFGLFRSQPICCVSSW